MLSITRLAKVTVVGLLLPAVALLGQTFRGGIAGTVLDTSGAGVPGAVVKVVDKDRGLTRELTTTTAGTFSVPDLPAGAYTVSIGRAGFQTQSIEAQVAVGRVTDVPVTLAVAAQSQAVEVRGYAALLETT